MQGSDLGSHGIVLEESRGGEEPELHIFSWQNQSLEQGVRE